LEDHHTVTSLEALETLYGQPSKRADLKVNDFLDKHSRAFIKVSTFVVLATCNREMHTDCSPRGDEAGFVHVLDGKTLLLPDRKGNNRTDSLKNIVVNPSVSLLFFVPNVYETFRVNGTAVISVDPVLLSRCVVQEKAPTTVLTVQEAYIHCSRALHRSNLWNPEVHTAAKNVPSIGTMLEAHTGGEVRAKSYDAYAKENVSETLY